MGATRPAAAAAAAAAVPFLRWDRFHGADWASRQRLLVVSSWRFSCFVGRGRKHGMLVIRGRVVKFGRLVNAGVVQWSFEPTSLCFGVRRAVRRSCVLLPRWSECRLVSGCDFGSGACMSYVPSVAWWLVLVLSRRIRCPGRKINERAPCVGGREGRAAPGGHERVCIILSVYKEFPAWSMCNRFLVVLVRDRFSRPSSRRPGLVVLVW
ncbi:unnamed protein product [Scytosiphon promiscuus]